MGELELLLQYLEQAVAKIDSAVQQGAAPKDRMKRLLTAKDKRAALLEMAGACLISLGTSKPCDIWQDSLESCLASMAAEHGMVWLMVLSIWHMCRQQRDRQAAHRPAAAEH